MTAYTVPARSISPDQTASYYTARGLVAGEDPADGCYRCGWDTSRLWDVDDELLCAGCTEAVTGDDVLIDRERDR